MKKSKFSQPLYISLIIAVTVAIAIAMIFSSKKSSDKETESSTNESEKEQTKSGEAEEHGGEGEIELDVKQLAEQRIQLAKVETGEVTQLVNLPGKLMVNTDQQAHVSPNFGGHVEQVNVELGQNVQKGQALAVLSVPELIDQQANLSMAQASLDLARKDYQREQQLWSQGISAKQDLQRAENAFRQAQISVQSTQARISALGATGGSNGRFIIRAPMSGVISAKDIVVGENVQLADQLFVIEQLKDLWLEFVLPAQQANQIQPQQRLKFKSLQSGQEFESIVQTLTTQADVQTGRLIVRAKVLSNAPELRANLMVNVQLASDKPRTVLRVQKSALQPVDGKDSVFIVESEKDGKVHFKAQPVVIGQTSADGQWLEITSGLNQGQKYVSAGSFLLKSELEKDEADHGH